MHLYDTGELDLLMDYQLIDAGGGLLETYALGKKTGSFQIGEIAMRNIKSRIDFLNDFEVQKLIQGYCDMAHRLQTKDITRIN